MLKTRYLLLRLETAAGGRWPFAAAASVAIAGLVIAGLMGLGRTERLPDFRVYQAGPARKAEFFAYIRPLVEAENAEVLSDRERLLEIAGSASPGLLDRLWLDGLAAEYGVDADELDREALLDALLRRVDVVPESLALAQAAKESGWGTSRFARDGNNLFGEWCFEPGCGIVPKSRAEGRSHEVQAFDSPEKSVASYLKNINTHPGYREFRQERARLRDAGRPLSGVELADQLTRYSERREDYVNELVRLIRYNGLEGRSGNAGG